MSFGILESILVILLIALGVTLVFRYMRLPVVLGYLVAGAIMGPHVLDWLPDQNAIKELAEFGIVLLMFTVGLEFSLSRLFALRHRVFFLGGLQVVISIASGSMLGLLLGMPLSQSLIIGCVIAMSSTAIVMKQLSDQYELHTEHGRNAFAILLAQDLAVIPMLIAIASFAPASTAASWTEVLLALMKGVTAIVIIIAAGRWLLQPVLRLIAATRLVETFTLAVLLIAIGAAWLTHVLGLSFVLGAFLAGMMLGETEFRHQIKVEIRPFKDILLGLFFISVGMLVNVESWYHSWVWILLMLLGFMFAKPLLITLLARLNKSTWSMSSKTGIILAQGGEFGFALLTLALTHQLLPSNYGQSVLAALLISMALAPMIIRHNEVIKRFILRVNKKHKPQTESSVLQQGEQLVGHVILCGYGRVGEQIAASLCEQDQAFIALELNPYSIKLGRKIGHNVTYGDAAHPQILEAARCRYAKAMVISFYGMQATQMILQYVTRHHPELSIFVRCKNQTELRQLESYGNVHAIAENVEAGKALCARLASTISC